MNDPESPQRPPDPPPSTPEPPAQTQTFVATLQGVWERIKQHKVVQWTLAYLAIAYTLLHGAEMLTGSLGWPHGWIRLFTLLLILGVPIVITLAWYHGSRGQQRASGTEIMIIALLLAIGGAVIWRDDGQDHATPTDSTNSLVEASRKTDDVTIADKTIAVLPFINLSSDKEQEYFSDGLSEEMLNLLAQVPELRVAARTSSFYFKGKDVKLPDIARDLRVAHLLEGSVRKSGDRIRITAQLVRGSDGYHQWSETYDRTLEDIFAVQEEIAAAVVAQLKITLLGKPTKTHTTSPEAYAIFLQARQLDRLGEDRLEESIALYRRVLAIDPNYAPAWVWLGSNYMGQVYLGLRPFDEGTEEARQLMLKAITIDPTYGVPHAGLGALAMNYDHDLAAAARHFERALALNPADVDTLAAASQLSFVLGRPDTAMAVAEYVAGRNPLDPSAHGGLGAEYFEAGRFDDSVASLRIALKLSPAKLSTHALMGDALLYKGDYQAALDAYGNEPSEPERLAGQAMAHHALGHTAQADAALAELIKKHSDWASLIACVYGYQRDADRSFEWLEKAVLLKDPGLSYLPVTRYLKPLHNDPRWLPFLRKLGKAPEQLAAIKFELKVPQH